MPTKYIFVTGGVVSGLGKGITNASIGLILRSAGLTVDVIKFDPYLNIDPGTMSPYEHGEVYVLADGSETDLDLGHYERFLDENLTGISSVTSGKIYAKILDEERNGRYLGKNVQLIPHVTNYIKHCFERNSTTDVRLIEIGGSTGDYEGDIYLESLRQFKKENEGKVFHIHLGFVPYLNCSGEYKTKPLQVSLRELSRSGLQPDMIVARYALEASETLSIENLRKLALFANLPAENILALPDLKSIYEVPKYLEESDLKNILEKFLDVQINSKLPEFYYKNTLEFTNTIKIALVAKYTKLTDAYLSILESLKIAGVENDTKIQTVLIDAEKLEINDEQEWNRLYEVNGIIVPGGFGIRGMNGKMSAIKWARENKVPFLGICLGLQMAVVEFAKNICGLNAVSAEMYEDRSELENKDVLIDLMPEQFRIVQKGGTMRLGVYDCDLESDTLAKNLFKSNQIQERHRHRLEVQNIYVSDLEANGLVISGKFYKNQEKSDFLVEIIELGSKTHPFFIATQSHPEFLSRPGKPHPLFDGIVKASLAMIGNNS